MTPHFNMAPEKGPALDEHRSTEVCDFYRSTGNYGGAAH